MTLPEVSVLKREVTVDLSVCKNHSHKRQVLAVDGFSLINASIGPFRRVSSDAFDLKKVHEVKARNTNIQITKNTLN